jgi:hypothetical protein
VDLVFLARIGLTRENWPFALAVALGMLPWLLVAIWANWRGTGKLRLDFGEVKEPRWWLAAIFILGGWGLGLVLAFYVTTWIFQALGLPPEGRTFDLAVLHAMGHTWTAPVVAAHLWLTRDKWRHGGRKARERAEGAA